MRRILTVRTQLTIGTEPIHPTAHQRDKDVPVS